MEVITGVNIMFVVFVSVMLLFLGLILYQIFVLTPQQDGFCIDNGYDGFSQFAYGDDYCYRYDGGVEVRKPANCVFEVCRFVEAVED